MSSQVFSDDDVTVLEWVVPRPTGRWHQSIVVTSRHVWVLPELTFADNEAMTAAADAGLTEFHEYLKRTSKITRPARCNLSDVRDVHWHATTGWMRVIAADGEVIGAMISNRETGHELLPELKRAIAARVLKQTKQD